MGVTLQDIASRCKVSVQTVSAILNKRGHLYREQTCRKVIEVADELGYRPNILARGLRGARTQTLGLIIPGLNSSSISNAKIQSVERAARQSGYRLLIGSYEGDADLVQEHVSDFLGLSVDGLIYWPGTEDQAPTLRRMREARKPVVLIEPPETGVAPTVTIDRALGGYLQVKHLHEIGRRRIAFLLTTFSHFKSQEKIQGIRQALAEVGVQMDPGLCLTRTTLDGSPPEVGARMVRDLLDAGREFDAVVTLSDGVALGALHELLRCGRRVPEDVAIVGYDDDSFANYTVVPLTTVHQPRALGPYVLELLEQQMGRGEAPAEVPVMALKPHLVVRASTLNNPASLATR